MRHHHLMVSLFLMYGNVTPSVYQGEWRDEEQWYFSFIYMCIMPPFEEGRAYCFATIRLSTNSFCSFSSQRLHIQGNMKMDSFARIELFDLMTLQKLALIDPFLWMEKS